MRYLVLLLIIAMPLHAQSLLDIAPGWSRDSAMAVLQGQYRVADTVVRTRWGYDHIIRMAPVQLLGYDGYVTLHSDTTGRVTSIVWVRIQEHIYSGEPGVWASFTEWQRWDIPTRNDYDALLKGLASRFDPWPYRVRPMASRTHPGVEVDSTLPVRGWANGSSAVTFWYDDERKELRYMRDWTRGLGKSEE